MSAAVEPRFESDRTGLSLTVGGARFWFSSAAAGDFAAPQQSAVELLEKASAIERSCWAQDTQVHRAAVHTLRDGDAVAAYSREADGQVTDRTDLLCAVRTADCLPVLLAGDGVVAALHAGWRGLDAGIIAAGVLAMRELGAAQVSAAIGPGARGCCYEVGDELLRTFDGYPAALIGERQLDLSAVARAQLEGAGVAAVHDCRLCTICSPDQRFFSWRRDGPSAGRMIAAAWLN